MEEVSTNSSERAEVLRLLALLKPFHRLSPATYFFDLSISAILTWGCLWLSSIRPFDLISAFLLVIAFLALYRSFSFMHEVVHFQKRIKFLNPMWNLLIGYPCMFPSFMHDPHRIHHLPNFFGTPKDPEYLCMSGQGLKLLFLPLLTSAILPIALTIRFGILSWFSPLLGKKFQKLLFQRFSTQVVNPGFVREIKSDKDLAEMRRYELFCGIYFMIWAALFITETLSLQFLISFYVIVYFMALMNVYRALIAHLYDKETSDSTLSPFALIRDSVSVEQNRLLTIFWAPAGIQYHSLHHLDPAIPYHNLEKAHRFLQAQLDPEHVYRQSVLPSFTDGMKQFVGTIRKRN